jgi:CO dehydrogenase/acetyl-CoA synthase alpha subunit
LKTQEDFNKLGTPGDYDEIEDYLENKVGTFDWKKRNT